MGIRDGGVRAKHDARVIVTKARDGDRPMDTYLPIWYILDVVIKGIFRLWPK